MSGIELPNLGLTGDIPDHATWGTEGRANDRRLDSLVMPAVESVLNDPPLSPADGVRYLVGTAPTGAWATQPNSIAVWESSAAGWTFYQPKSGWSAYDKDAAESLRFTDEWAPDQQETSSVKRYGATGDGVTNDSAAVLAAIVAAPAGSRLYFPAGTYLLSTWTTAYALTKRLWICGDGMGNSIVKATADSNFLSITDNFRCSDITFDTWRNVLDFSALAVSQVLDQVLIEDIEIKTYGKAVFASSSTVGAGFRSLRIVRCNFANGSDGVAHDRGGYPIFISMAIMEDIQILNNISKTSIARGINLGNNTLGFTLDRGLWQIIGNKIEDVTAIHPAGAEGIIVYGWRCVIANNVVKNVWKTTDEGTPDEDATDANGIYTKCRFTTIQGNVLVDAGQAEGFIDVKGYARTDTSSAQRPFGYGCVVSGNILIDTQVNPTAAGGGRRTLGIKLATSEAMVVGNYIEGVTSIGIYTESGESNNHLIANNMLKNIRGAVAIECFGGGDNIRVINNTIDTVLGSYIPATTYGIKLSKNGGGNVDVSGNRVLNLAGVEVTVDPATNVLTTVLPATLATPHGLAVSSTIKFETTGTLPAGIAAATTYYVKTVPTLTTFTISATDLGAELDITDVGTGRLIARRTGAHAGIQISPGAFNKEVTANATTNTLTVTAPHALRVWDRVKFTPDGIGGALPLGILDGTWYYIRTLPTVLTLTLSETLGGVEFDFTDNGSGTNTMHRETISHAWRVADNHVDGAFYAIQFTYDVESGLVTLDDVLVRHNTWRSIDPGTVANGDEIKFSDTPTNLVLLPAEMPSGLKQVGFVPDIWELKNGNEIQSIRVYGNGDGLTPSLTYERFTFAMDASHATLNVEKATAGTPVTPEDLWLAFNGVAAWKIKASSGDLQPVVDGTQDIGTALLQIQNLFMSKLLTISGGAYNTGHIILGTRHLWIGGDGNLRIKDGAPVSTNDGTIVGTQA